MAAVYYKASPHSSCPFLKHIATHFSLLGTILWGTFLVYVTIISVTYAELLRKQRKGHWRKLSAVELRILLKILYCKIQFWRIISLLENIGSLNKVSSKYFSLCDIIREGKENIFPYGSFLLRNCIDLFSYSFLLAFPKVRWRFKRAVIMSFLHWLK
jgi:hypothetical protein